MRLSIVPLAVFALSILSVGCSPRDARPPLGEASPTPTPTATPAVSCADRPARCTAWNRLERCEPDGVTWSTTVCAGGCYDGACSLSACADECALGATGTDGTCGLWDLALGTFVEPDPVAFAVDRARDYDARLFVHNLPHGAVANTHYTDSSLEELSFHADLGDSALWTGSLLAAEAWRAEATGSPAAAARMATLVETLHRDFAITGHPGYLARFAAPAGSPYVPELESSCDLTHHCDVDYEGEAWSWLGHTSRDQYTGVMLGLLLAYRATHDEALRETIREDVVGVARELATVRTGVPVHVVLGSIPIDTTMTLENVILSPSETIDGRVWLVVDTGNFSNTDLYGAREFLPDLSTALTQIPGFSWLPPIKRASSSIMLGAFLRMAIEMTEGVPGRESDHAMLSAYYEDHADAWLADAKSWTFDSECGSGYYSTHIAYISAYAWAATETDDARLAEIRDAVLTNRMWSAVDDHKNAYFAFLWGGVAPGVGAGDPAIAGAAAQLAQFPAAPRVNRPVDHVADYPNSSSCTHNGQPQSTVAVDVGDRLADEFIWERGPWALYTEGNPAQVYSGTDYLAAYWAGRRHGLVADDRPGTCARWAP